MERPGRANYGADTTVGASIFPPYDLLFQGVNLHALGLQPIYPFFEIVLVAAKLYNQTAFFTRIYFGPQYIDHEIIVPDQIIDKRLFHRRSREMKNYLLFDHPERLPSIIFRSPFMHV
jgi:hypothetical protein